MLSGERKESKRRDTYSEWMNENVFMILISSFFFIYIWISFWKKYLHFHSDAKAIIMGYLNMRTEMQHTNIQPNRKCFFFLSLFYLKVGWPKALWSPNEREKKQEREIIMYRKEKERVVVCKTSFKGSLSIISETFHRLVYIHTIGLCDDIFVHRPSQHPLSILQWCITLPDMIPPNKLVIGRNKSKLDVPIQLGIAWRN